MAILSQTAEYALRAATYLAQQSSATAIDVGALAEAVDVPRNYLSKVLSQLSRTGVLASTRGKKGGFELARDPASIPILDVVAPFEHLDGPRRCLLGQQVCNERHPCPAHRQWRVLSEELDRFLRGTTLADLARGHTRWPGRQAAGHAR